MVRTNEQVSVCFGILVKSSGRGPTPTRSQILGGGVHPVDRTPGVVCRDTVTRVRRVSRPNSRNDFLFDPFQLIKSVYKFYIIKDLNGTTKGLSHSTNVLSEDGGE